MRAKTRIATLSDLSRPIVILSRIANARTNDERITVSSRGSELVLSASIGRESYRFDQTGPVAGKVWFEYRADAEGAISQELGIEPRLFKVAAGSAKGLTLEVRNEPTGEGSQVRIKTTLEITDVDGVTTECLALGSDGVEKARSFAGNPWGRATVGELVGPFSWACRAISDDDGRPHLAALALIGSRVIATDGHRLHVGPLPSGLHVEIESLIPSIVARALLEIFKSSSPWDEVVIEGNGEGLMIDVGSHWSMAVRFPTLSDNGTERVVRFPSYTKVIPNPWDRPGGMVVECDSGRLLKAMKKSQGVLKGNFVNGVVIRPEPNQVRITAENTDNNIRVEMKVPAETRLGNPGFLYYANVDYVIDALLDSGDVEIYIGPEAFEGTYKTAGANAWVDEEDRKGLGYTTDPTVFSHGEDTFAVVMPMRL
jgi:DNA polymerase III sliding clamp (beta) subunit (PCNA family)